MIEITNNLNKVSGGDILSESLCMLAGTLVGYVFTASFQDGYCFTGVRGSGYENDFMISVNKALDAKKSREISEAQLKEQKKTNDILRGNFQQEAAQNYDF